MSTDTALVVIDVQGGMFSASDPVYQGDELLTRIGHLLEKARQAHIPIVYIQHTSERQGHPLEVGTAGWQIHPAIAPLAGDTIMQKQMPDAFYKTDLVQPGPMSLEAITGTNWGILPTKKTGQNPYRLSQVRQTRLYHSSSAVSSKVPSSSRPGHIPT